MDTIIPMVITQLNAPVEYDHNYVYFAYIYIFHVVDTCKDLPYTVGQEMWGNSIEMNREQSSKSDRIFSVAEYCEYDGQHCAYSQGPE